MTEPVPGQTPEPAVADDATATPPPAGQPAAEQQSIETPGPGGAASVPHPAESGQDTAGPTPAGPTPAGPGPGAAADPQELFGSLSLTAIEADIDRLMNDKMSRLDGMLAGLEELVQRLEGEITNLEPPPDDPTAP